MCSRSYRLPFCLWPLGLKPGHLFTVVDRHQHLPHSQQDQADAHDGEGDPQNNHGDVGRLRATWDKTEDEVRLQSSRLVLAVLQVVVKLTIHLQTEGDDPHLTFHHIERNPALVVCHQRAMQRRALVIIWKEIRTVIYIRKAWINRISPSLATLCAGNVKGYSRLCFAVRVISISKATIWCVCMCVCRPHHCISHVKPENPLW